MITKRSNYAKLRYVSIVLLLAAGFNIANAQQTPSFSTFRQIPLELDQTKRAIDAVLYLRENFQRDNIVNGTPSQIVGAMKSNGSYAAIQSALLKYGFTSPESWSQVAQSSVMAIGFIKNNGGKNMPQQMRELQRNNTIDVETKARLIATMRSMTPPEVNMQIARQLLADTSFAEKIERLFDN